MWWVFLGGGGGIILILFAYLEILYWRSFLKALPKDYVLSVYRWIDPAVGHIFSYNTTKMGITFQNKIWVQNAILPKYVTLHETRWYVHDICLPIYSIRANVRICSFITPMLYTIYCNWVYVKFMLLLFVVWYKDFKLMKEMDDSFVVDLDSSLTKVRCDV